MLKSYFHFGWKVLGTELIYTLEGDIRSLIVGKVFGSSDLAYYDQGKKYPNLFVTNISTTINKVMLPSFSREQDNILNLKKMLRKAVNVGMFLLAPLLVGFALISDNFIIVLLTEKWNDAIPFIQIFCIAYLLRPLETSCQQALLAVGKSGEVMKIMFGINIFAVFTVLIAVMVFKSVFMIAVGSLISSIVSVLLFMSAIWKEIKYSPREQFEDIYPTIILCSVMAIIVWSVGKITIISELKIIIQIVCGGIVYLLGAHFTKNKAYQYILTKIKAQNKQRGI